MLDATGLRVLARVAVRSDDNLLRTFAAFLAARFRARGGAPAAAKCSRGGPDGAR